MGNALHPISGFFGALHHKVETHRGALQHVDHYLSTRFNTLDYVNPNELMLSRIFRDLLDPYGPHGQGNFFLDAFLGHAGIPELIGVQPLDVHTEWPTTHLATSRRIDILIQYAHYGIGIENKPWARDQESPVSDYQRNLDLQFASRYHLVYLTSDGRSPSDHHDEQRLRLLSYRRDVTDWLEECERLCRSDKFRWFLRDLNTYTRREFPLTPTEEQHDYK